MDDEQLLTLQLPTLIDDALTAAGSRLFCRNEYSRYSIMGPNSLTSLGICILHMARMREADESRAQVRYVPGVSHEGFAMT